MSPMTRMIEVRQNVLKQNDIVADYSFRRD